MNALLIDVGGTWTRLARSDGRRLITVVRQPTAKTWTQAKRNWIEAAGQLFANTKIQRVVVGLPGLLDRRHSTVVATGNLHAWERQPIARDARRIFRAVVNLENDAALGGLGETRYGAGRRQGIVAFLTIGTGVGGARIVRGRIDRRAEGFEPGHQIIDMVAGRARTLEDLVSGGNIRRRFRRSPETLHNRKVWTKLSHELALGIVNVINLWSPDVVVLGGGVLPAYRKHLGLIRQTAKSQRGRLPVPPIRIGQLGDRAGLYGALALAHQK